MKVDYRDKWLGKTIVCIASGPSLTKEDCDYISNKDVITLVTNTTYQICPWADLLFGFDAKWWKFYMDDVKLKFKGERLTCSVTGESFGVTTLYGKEWFDHFGNSGTAIISLAIVAGAKRVIMLGYDCQPDENKWHWHGNHPEGFNNCKSMIHWPTQFKKVKRYADIKNVEIINCSRKTSLDMFKKDLLENVI